MRFGLLTLAALCAAGCVTKEPIEREGGGGTTADGAGGSGGVITTGSGATSASGGGGNGGSGNGGNGGSAGPGGSAPCPDGVTCVGTFVFVEQTNTASGTTTDSIDSYACAPATNESGPEAIYRVDLPSAGFLSAAIYDDAGTDIDVHLLTTFNPAAPSGDGCVARGDKQAAANVPAGSAWVIADTWVNGSGTELSGPFKIEIGFIPVPSGACEMETGEMARVGDGGDHLAMPATGPVVMEAHLVTAAEPAPFPSTATEELAEHYALSQQTTKLVMQRNQVWAPLEGGDFYGAGISDPGDFPVAHEGWYVNMYWTPAARPPAGTKMILRNAADPSRAVVVAAGYETGPGDLSRIGGTTEEVHYYLGTDHDSEMTLGIASDQSLPFGPMTCTN